jgi:cytochrome b561
MFCCYGPPVARANARFVAQAHPMRLSEGTMMVQTAEYGTSAKSFHWLTAGLLGSQFVIGWIMPGVRNIAQPEGLISLHFSLGMTILALTAARLLWRLAVGAPAPEASLPKWQYLAAEILHTALYLLLFALVFSGWAYASSHGVVVTFFGLATVPAIFAKGSVPGTAIGELHSTLGWILLAALGLHIAAAFYHHFWLRDRVLSRMLPWVR